MEDREVDEADGRGEPAGDASAVEGDESESTFIARFTAGFLAACRLVDVAEAMLVGPAG